MSTPEMKPRKVRVAVENEGGQSTLYEGVAAWIEIDEAFVNLSALVDRVRALRTDEGTK